MEMNVTENTLRVEIPASVFARIMRNKAIAVADLKCLDAHTKDSIRQICLQVCLATDK
ncbi:MAG: hypothetical protein H7A01_15250 [Hahellaceae bacterium]|jgi:hypothetical protein|nr:hypothetical protein [Hahellaceae bacterium]MCP5210418.1 hypothetical protein [Hahellaceae bacterium]